MSSQTQHFGVTDAQGNAVVVHWNVSGLHCSGLACGNIDADGNYTPPSSLSQPLEITLEGVVVSDPNYSVMTHVQIVPGTAASAASVPASSTQIADVKQVPPVPVVEKAASAPSFSLPSNQPITPPPSVAADSGRQPIQPPTAQVVAATPKVEAHAAATNAGALSLPNAVAAAPVVKTSSNSNHQQMPLPNAVAAAPVVKEKKRKSGDGMILLDLPSTVSNLTAPKKTESTQPSLANVAAAPVSAGTSNKAVATTVPASSKVTTSPSSNAAVPTVAADVRQTTSGTSSSPHVAASSIATIATAAPLPSISTATTTPSTVNVAPAPKSAPKMETQSPSSGVTPARATPEVQASRAVSVAPPVVTNPAAAIVPVKPAQIASASGASSFPNVSLSAAPSAASVPSATVGATEPTSAGTVVTYRDGKLKIDAENITLAEVLQLVAKKMGAVIDVPAGSGQERIVEHVGPGYPNDVLTRLLNGSHFNFIIVNSALHPNEPAEVLLSMQGTDTSTPVVAPPTPTAAPSSVFYTPPDPTLRPLPLPPQYDSSLTPPPNRDSLTPDAISQLMREKAKELRERAMQQAGVQPDTSQPPPPQPAPAPEQ